MMPCKFCWVRRKPGGTELDVLNEWLNVLQSVQIPFALLPVRLPGTIQHPLVPFQTSMTITRSRDGVGLPAVTLCLRLPPIGEVCDTYASLGCSIGLFCPPTSVLVGLRAQLLMLTSSGAVMGAAFRNGRAMTIAAWAIAAAIMAINGTLLWELLLKELPAHWAARTGFLACVALYLSLVLYFALGPDRCAPGPLGSQGCARCAPGSP